MTEGTTEFPLGILIAIVAAATAIIGVLVACAILYRRQSNPEAKALMRRTGVRIGFSLTLLLVLPTFLAIMGHLPWIAVFAGFGAFQLSLMITILRMRRGNRKNSSGASATRPSPQSPRK